MIAQRNEYTTRLGLKFIDNYKVEFFIGYLYGIRKNMIETKKNELVKSIGK